MLDTTVLGVDLSVFVIQCRAKVRNRLCTTPAGDGTPHPGFGHCSRHQKSGESESWELAMQLARELEVSPWEALLYGVKLSAGAVQDTELKLATASKAELDQQNIGDTTRYWRTESRHERRLMMTIATAAIKAGVAERIVRQAEVEGQLVAAALVHALDAVSGLTPEQRIQALTAAQTHLASIDETVVGDAAR